jgi:hypothetical protein
VIDQVPDRRFFCCAACVLVRPDDRAVKIHGLEVRVLRQYREYLAQHARLRPTAEALIHTVPAPEPLWQIPPGRASTKYPEQSFNEQPIVGSATSICCLAWQHITDSLPPVISKHVSFHRANVLRRFRGSMTKMTTKGCRPAGDAVAGATTPFMCDNSKRPAPLLGFEDLNKCQQALTPNAPTPT